MKVFVLSPRFSEDYNPYSGMYEVSDDFDPEKHNREFVKKLVEDKVVRRTTKTGIIVWADVEKARQLYEQHCINTLKPIDVLEWDFMNYKTF